MKDVNFTIQKDGLKAGPFQKDGTLASVSLDLDAYFPSLDINKCASLAEETRWGRFR